MFVFSRTQVIDSIGLKTKRMMVETSKRHAEGARHDSDQIPRPARCASDPIGTRAWEAVLEAHHALQDYCKNLSGLINRLHGQLEQVIEIHRKNLSEPE